jgi:hypothetical protein
MGVVDEDVRPQVECGLDVVGDRDADALAAERLADVAAELAPRDGRLQHEIVRRDDGRDELAADRAERPRETDVEWLGDDGTAEYTSDFGGTCRFRRPPFVSYASIPVRRKR